MEFDLFCQPRKLVPRQQIVFQIVAASRGDVKDFNNTTMMVQALYDRTDPLFGARRLVPKRNIRGDQNSFGGQNCVSCLIQSACQNRA